MDARLVKMRHDDAISYLFFSYLTNYCAINKTDNVVVLDPSGKPMFSAKMLDSELIQSIKELRPDNKWKEGKQ